MAEVGGLPGKAIPTRVRGDLENVRTLRGALRVAAWLKPCAYIRNRDKRVWHPRQVGVENWKMGWEMAVGTGRGLDTEPCPLRTQGVGVPIDACIAECSNTF